MGSLQPLEGRDKAKQVSRTVEKQIYQGPGEAGSQHLFLIGLQGSTPDQNSQSMSGLARDGVSVLTECLEVYA